VGLVYINSDLFKPLIKRLEICEEVVTTLERALPNDEHKVRKVEKETLDQMQKFIGVMTKEIGPKYMVQLIVSEILLMDEEREKMYNKHSATQDLQLAGSIHELLEILASGKNTRDKRQKLT